MCERTTHRTMEEYRIARNEAKNICQRKNKLFQENIQQHLQDKFGRNETRKYYESIHNIKHGFQPRTNVTRQAGKSICWQHRGTKQIERILEYSEEHLNSNVIRNLEDSGNIYYGPEPETSEPTPKMVYNVIKKP
jgi:hypothetical protein